MFRVRVGFQVGVRVRVGVGVKQMCLALGRLELTLVNTSF